MGRYKAGTTLLLLEGGGGGGGVGSIFQDPFSSFHHITSTCCLLLLLLLLFVGKRRRKEIGDSLLQKMGPVPPKNGQGRRGGEGGERTESDAPNTHERKKKSQRWFFLDPVVTVSFCGREDD